MPQVQLVQKMRARFRQHTRDIMYDGSALAMQMCALVDSALRHNNDVKVHELAFFMQAQLADVVDR